MFRFFGNRVKSQEKSFLNLDAASALGLYEGELSIDDYQNSCSIITAMTDISEPVWTILKQIQSGELDFTIGSTKSCSMVFPTFSLEWRQNGYYVDMKNLATDEAIELTMVESDILRGVYSDRVDEIINNREAKVRAEILKSLVDNG